MERSHEQHRSLYCYVVGKVAVFSRSLFMKLSGKEKKIQYRVCVCGVCCGVLWCVWCGVVWCVCMCTCVNMLTCIQANVKGDDNCTCCAGAGSSSGQREPTE